MRTKKNQQLANYKQNQIVLKELKFKNIDIKNILRITPNQLYGVWRENKARVDREIAKTKREITTLREELRVARKSSRKEKLTRRINEDMQRIEQLNNQFMKWSDNLQNTVNGVVKQILNKILGSANNQEVELLAKEFGNELSKPYNAQRPLQNILINYLKEYKNKRMPVKRKNAEVEIVNEPEIINREEVRNNIAEDVRRNISPVFSNQGNNTRYFGVSFFYGSSGGSNNTSNGKKSSESLLLNALDAVSDMLYGSIQNSLTELYDKINDK